MSRLPGIDWCRQREASATTLASLACTRLGDLKLQSCAAFSGKKEMPGAIARTASGVSLGCVVCKNRRISDELCKMCTFTFSWLHASSRF